MEVKQWWFIMVESEKNHLKQSKKVEKKHDEEHP